MRSISSRCLGVQLDTAQSSFFKRYRYTLLSSCFMFILMMA